MVKRTGRKELLAELERRSGAALTHKIEREDVPPATPAELLELSTLFNAQMAALRPRDASDGRNFYRLFKHMDLDGSGRVSFKELARMIRDELQLSRADMPHAKLLGLWRALDKDTSGYICAGEFGRFMNLKGPAKAEAANPHVAANERKREVKLSEVRRSEELWKLRAARRAEATAAALASEAHKLESALLAAGAAKGRGDAPFALPQISPNGARMHALTNGLSPSASTGAAAGALETNAALQKLARETLALGQGGR